MEKIKSYAQLKKENENKDTIIKAQRETIEKLNKILSNYDKWITDNYNEIVKVCKAINI